MKKPDPQRKEDILTAIAAGLVKQSQIAAALGCSRTYLSNTMQAMVSQGLLEETKIKQTKVYSLKVNSMYNDPFSLAKPVRAGQPYAWPPRRAHFNDARGG